MATTCRRCDYSITARVRFCPSCGAPQDAAYADSSQRFAEERIELLCRYLPKNLVKHLMTERRAPLGQLAVAAVVFADISGFTAMSERMDPEQVLRVMNGCFEGLVEAVERHDGVVDKFIGDCLMAVFGVPVAHEDDAARAVRACMEMFTFLEEYNKNLGKPLELSVGINYGPLVAGNLGSRTRMDYTVMGRTVNLSQRLEAAATAGQILVSEAVQRAAGSEIYFDPLEPIRIKGISDPVNVFLASRRVRRRRQARLLPCMGRDQYLGPIQETLQSAGEQGVVIDLYGDSGVGKSRIAEEIAGRWSKAFIVWAPGFGRARPYGAIGAVVEAVCGIDVEDSAARRQQKLSRLQEIGIEEGWRLFLSHVVSVVSTRDATVGELDGESVQRGVLAATRVLFEALSASRHLIVLDGIERYDAHSVDVLSKLWPANPPQGLRLISTRTPDAALLFAGFAGSGWVRSIEVEPLDEETSIALAAARLSLEVLPRTAARFLFEQAAGNPRYTLELIASLLETGYIYQSDRGYIVRDDLDKSPRGLEFISLVRSRIDRLPVDQKYLLQAGALYGTTFPGDIVSAAIGKPRHGPQWLVEIADRGLLVPHDTQYSFGHALVHQATIESLTSEQRAALYGHLGAALETHPDARRQESIPRLARFFGESTDVKKAAYYLERSGNYLLKNGEHERAAESFERLVRLQSTSSMLSTLSSLPDTAVRAQILAGRAWEMAGEIQKAFQFYRGAEDAADQAGSSLLIAESRRYLARLLRLQGNPSDARQRIAAALGAARLAGDSRTLAWVLLEAAEIDLAAQRIAQASAKLQEAQKISSDLCEDDREGSVRGRCLGRLGRLALAGNDLEGALALLGEAASVCESAHDHRELVRLNGNLGILCHKYKRDGARPYFERAIGLAGKIGDRLGEAKQLHNLGSFLLSQGDRDSARACFVQSYDLARALEWMEGVAVNSNAIKQLEAR